MSELGDHARRLHDEALGWDPRRTGSPVHQAHHAGDAALQTLQDLAALTGAGSWLDRDPRDIAAQLGGLAQMAHSEEFPQASTWARVVAYGLAGWCAAARAEEFDITSGDAA